MKKKSLFVMGAAMMLLFSCSSERSETEIVEKPGDIIPAIEYEGLYAVGFNQLNSDGVSDAGEVVFTEDDILWFDTETRELKFKNTDNPLSVYKRLEPYRDIRIYFGQKALFDCCFVTLFDSWIYNDLVLCYGKMDGEVDDNGCFYFYDCYPIQFQDTEEVRANREKKEDQWKAFLRYLEGMGKLKRSMDKIRADYPDAIGYVSGGNKHEGWNNTNQDVTDPLVAFFQEELHRPYWDENGNEIKTFFEQGSWDEESCMMINSREDFQKAYMGTKELPEIDFDKYTLIIGRTWGNDSSYELAEVFLRDNGDNYSLDACLWHHYGGAFAAIIHIFYWRLYPKLPQKDIVTNHVVYSMVE